MGFKERLKEARLEKGYTQEQLAKLIGVAKSTFTGYEKGNSEPNMLTIKKIMDILEIDANYLWADEIDNDVSFVISFSEQKLIKKYRNLDNHGIQAVNSILDIEYDRCVKEQETIYQPKRYIDKLPNIASAGIGDYLFDDIPFEKIEVDDDCQADFAIGVDGDSMEPTFSHNDTVLVKKQDTINVGEIGIFIVDGECFIKEYAKDRLISHNKNYPDKEFNECMDIRLIGKVIGY